MTQTNNSDNKPDLILGKTKSDWRQFKKTLSNLPDKNLPQRYSLLDQLVSSLNQITLSHLDRKSVDFVITQIAIPIVNSLISTTLPESSLKIDAIVNDVTRIACKMFKGGGDGELLKTVVNVSATLFKKEEGTRKEEEEGGVKEDGKKSGVIENAPAYIPDPQVAIPMGDNTNTSTALAVIPQQPAKPQSKTFIQQDDLLLPTYSQNHYLVMPRGQLSAQGISMLTIFLQQLPLSTLPQLHPNSLILYLQLLTKLSPYIYTQHLRNLFPHLLTLLWHYFLNLDQTLTKCITKKLLQQFFTTIEHLFDRLQDKQKEQWLETFIVEITLKMIRSHTLQVKITGTKLLSEVCNDVNLGLSKFIKTHAHKEWLLRNRVYEEVVSLDKHEEVLQAAGEIIKFLIRSNVFLLRELKGIFAMAEKATPVVERLLVKPVSEVSMRFFDPEAEYIQEWIRKHKQPWYEELVDMLYYPSRYTSERLCHKGIQIFWQALLGYDNHPPLVSQRISRRYLQLLNGALDKGFLQQPIKPAIQIAKRFTNQTHLLKLLKKYIQLFPHSQQQTKFPTYKTTDFLIVKDLIENNGFLERLLKMCSQAKTTLYEEVMECITLLVLKYREHVKSEEFVSYRILLPLSNNSRMFGQLLFYFKEDSEVLFQTLCENVDITPEMFNCIKQLFSRMNRDTITEVFRSSKSYQITIPPVNLLGYPQLLNIPLTCNSLKVKQQSSQFLCSLFQSKQQQFTQFIDWAVQATKQAYNNKDYKKLLGCCVLLQAMMNETEKKGVGALIPHSSRVNTESVRVTVNNQVTYGYYLPRKYQEKFVANRTLFELLVEVARCFKCSPNDILLKYNQVEIKQTSNGLSIEELGLKNCELVAGRRERDPIPKSPLLQHQKLTQKATQVFTEIYFRFSPSGKMTPQQLSKFVQCSTKDDCCDANDSRVVDTFKKFDQNKDNILQLSDFLSFFQDSCKNRQGTVWKNLQALLYRPDLRRQQQVLDEVVDYHKLARYKLYTAEFTYQMLFELTKNRELRDIAVKLLKRLPTSKAIIEEMLERVEFEVKEEFQVWYRLALLQYLLMEGAKEEGSGNSGIDQERVKQWKKKFNNAHLYLKILEEAERIAKEPLSKQSDLAKSCLALCLQILRSLNEIPRLDKPLPENPETKLIEIPSSGLVVKLIPELYENMIGELYEPVLCLLLLRKQPLKLALVEKGLFYPDKEVRLMTCNFLYLYQRKHKFALNLFDVKVGKNCQEYFSMLVRFLFQDDKIDLKKMLKTTLDDIQKHQVNQGISTNKHDQLFLGKLQLLQTILILQPNLTPTSLQPLLLLKLDKTLSQQNLDILYRLLLRTPLPTVITSILNYITSLQPRKATQPKAHGYVGLLNLGCICYMNAVLQQLFMTREFRYPVLGVEVEDKGEGKERNGRKYYSVLYELRRMFAYLELSERGEYNPEGFCYAFDGNIQLSNQEDSQEFLSNLFDRLERELKTTHLKKLLSSVYGGQTISTILCQSCNTPTYRQQDFYDLSLDIKGFKSLDECLHKMVQSQPIQGYYCQKCAKKVTTSKSTHLYKLPNTLIVHLQRITYSYDTFSNVKLHHSISFPSSLNLLSYVKVRQGEDRPEQSECQYELKGVIVHSGQANEGHYYSLIKDSENSSSWLKFDDSRVTPFSSSQIQEETFGGRHEYSDWAYSGYETRSKNAYMLVYDKKGKRLDKQEEGKQVVRKIPEVFEKEILNDNQNVFFRELQFSNKGFFKFIKSILQRLPFSRQIYQQFQSGSTVVYSKYQSLPPSSRLQMTNLLQLLHKIIQILTKTSQPDQQLLKQIFAYLSLLYFLLPDITQLYLTPTRFNHLLTTMLTHYVVSVRELHRMMMNRAISIVVELNGVKDLLGAEDEATKRVVGYLDRVLEVMPELHKNSAKMKQYFEFWRVFAFERPAFMDYCFNREFIVKLTTFLLQKRSPIKNDLTKTTISDQLINRCAPPILHLLAGLILNSSPNPSTTSPARYTLTAQHLHLLHSPPLYKQTIESQPDLSSILAITTHLSLNHRHFSQQLAKILLSGINSSSVFSYMTIVHGFLGIEDTLQLNRLGWVLGVPQVMTEGHEDYSLRASLHSQVYTYVSSMDLRGGSKSVLELLFLQRKSPDRSSIAGVRILLDLLGRNQRVLRYVAALPPPNYFYAKYTDWIEEFIHTFKNDKHLVLDGSKEKEAETCQNLLNNINIKINKLIETSGVEELNTTVNFDVLPSLFPTYIIGKNFKIQPLQQIDFSNTNTNITIKPMIHHTFALKSQPTGVNNLALPRQTFNTINMPIDKQKQRNKLVKLFTYNPGTVQQSDQPLPQVLPTIITLQVNSNVNLKLDFTHPTFTHQLQLTSGRTKITVPYTTDPIFTWLSIHPEIIKPQSEPQATQASRTAAQHSSQYSEFYDEMAGMACPVCTFQNFGRRTCEMCDSLL